MNDYAHVVGFSAAITPYLAHYVQLRLGLDGVERIERMARPVVGWAVVTRPADVGYGLTNIVEPMVQGEYGETALTLAYDAVMGGHEELIGLHPEGEEPDGFRATQAAHRLTAAAEERRQRRASERGAPSWLVAELRTGEGGGRGAP